jgi:hypothetical protein
MATRPITQQKVDRSLQWKVWSISKVSSRLASELKSLAGPKTEDFR